jgi:hypothetical protein
MIRKIKYMCLDQSSLKCSLVQAAMRRNVNFKATAPPTGSVSVVSMLDASTNQSGGDR